MTKVNLVFNDIDGCFGNFKKPKKYPEKQSLEGHEELLSKIKRFIQYHPEVKFSACTGRSLYLCDNILEATGINELSSVEMGQAVYNPSDKKQYSLYRILMKNGQICNDWYNVIQKLHQFNGREDYLEKIDNSLMLFFRKTHIKRLKDNKHMLTYEFSQKYQGEEINGNDIAKVIIPLLPKEIQDSFERGIMVVKPSKTAVDIRPFLNKGHSIDYILTELGRTGEGCLAIGDSFHSDKDMMECCEYVACPANSDENLKDYVNDRKGYVSKEPFGNGILEIYESLI